MKNKKKVIIGLEVAKLHHKIVREIEFKISETMGESMSATHGQIIGFLKEESKSERDVFQRDIEKFMGLKRSSVSLILSNMQKNDLVKREPVAHDARLKKITLTEKSKALHMDIINNFESVEDTMRNDVSEEEVLSAIKTLNKFYKNLNAVPEKEFEPKTQA